MANSGCFKKGQKAWNKQDLTIKCDYCQKEFKITEYKLNNFKNHYCSRKCKTNDFKGRETSEETRNKLSVAMKKYLENHEHPTKNKPSWNKGRKETRQEVLKKISDGHKGQESWNKGLMAEQNHNWMGGGNAYWHGLARKIVEKVIGRKLKSDEAVHHIDGNWKNNNNNNLLVCTRSYHTWLHHELIKKYGNNWKAVMQH